MRGSRTGSGAAQNRERHGGEEIVGAGRLGRLRRVKRVGKERLERWGMKLTCRPHASEGEGRKGGAAGWASAQEEKGEGARWAGTAGREGGEQGFFSYFF